MASDDALTVRVFRVLTFRDNSPVDWEERLMLAMGPPRLGADGGL